MLLPFNSAVLDSQVVPESKAQSSVLDLVVFLCTQVDVMLGSFMDDIGISADQFEAACKLSARDLAGLPAHFHRRLFEQIWAANDYEMFVKMMTHKNVELQLQVGSTSRTKT